MLVTWARVYYKNETRDSLLWVIRVYYLYFDGNSFLLRSSHIIATGYAILAGLFACVGLRLVLYTVASGHLRFGAMTTRITRRLSSVAILNLSQKPAQPSKEPPPQRIRAKILSLYDAFGIHGQYFEVRLVLDELVELTTQTIAAYSSSQSISNASLNQTFGIIIFLNCISGLVFHRIFHDSVIKQRVACLVCDVVLDFAWGAILPVWSAVPLLRIYDTIAQLGANVDYTVNSTREVERVLMLSWGSYMLSIIPFCTSFLSTLELLAILREIVPDKSSDDVVPSKTSQPEAKFYSRSRIAPIKPWLKKSSGVVHVLMALYGITVLVVSLTANQVFGSFESHAEYECLHRVNPWLSTKESCIGRKINCTSLSIRGNTTEIDHALEAFDPSTLSDLFFSDCEALQIPSTIRDFPRLQSFGIKHSTIASWENDAALTQANFPGLKTLNMNNISFLTDADLTGLLTHELSPSVEWIHINNIPDVASRLLEPLNMRQLWREILYFDCDSCRLTAFPDLVLGMYQLVALSFVDNDLDQISDLWGANGDLELQALWLDGNSRLANLPDSVWHAAKTCEVVSMTFTNLSALPVWLPTQSSSGFSIAATSTPLCDSTQPSQLSTELLALLMCE